MLQDFIGAHKGEFRDQTELRAQTNTVSRVNFLAGNMVGNEQSVTGGVSARVHRGGTAGFASMAEYSEDGVRRVLAAATENALFMDRQVNRGRPPFPAVAGGNVPPKTEPREQAKQAALIEFSKALDALITGRYKDLSSRYVTTFCLDIEKLIAVGSGSGIDGTDGRFFQPRTTVYVGMTAEDSEGHPVELYQSFGGFGGFDELFSDPALLVPELDGLHRRLMDKRDGVFAEAGLRRCVLHPDLAGMLAHEAVGHTTEADLVLGGSVAGTNLGKPVASELIGLVDFAHTALGKTCPLPVYLDDEGVPAEDVTIIENGILKNFMHSRETARHFETKPQGNARAFLFSDEPLIRMRNTAILPGRNKLEELIAGVDDGYYLIKTGNGQADATGEFMFSVTMGYEIKGGKLGRAIRDTTISGVAFEMLKTVDMVSDDFVWEAAGFCGKKQPMTVGMGGPAIRCELAIGGK
ncbi:MAG: TldD/PmbA family protein [Treponema sp.]|nr:TldD/PmbA family protein [Treponema sp.]